MSSREGTPPGGVTLCMVVHTRSGNLANALNSVNRIAERMVIVDAGGGGGQAVKHLASEYDALYLQVPADPDESALLNTALDHTESPWALFLHQQEVLHVNDPLLFGNSLENAAVNAYNIPIVHFNDPGNHFFKTRLIRTNRELRWEHTIYPSLVASLQRAADEMNLERPVVAVIPHAAIVSLGEPDSQEWELRDAIVRLEKELDRDPEAVRYWYYLAETATRLEEWDRANSAVEEGLTVMSRQPEAPYRDPQAVNGLIGMFCTALLVGKYYPEKTVESLWSIYENMEGDGRFSVPLGYLLQAIGRKEDAVFAQRQAVENFFRERWYHLSLEEGLFKPILLMWEIRFQDSREELLHSVVEIQSLLTRHRREIRPALQYVHDHNTALFTAIQEVLQTSLKKLG